MRFMVAVALWSLAGVIYFLPSIVARRKRKKNTDRITIVNLLLGWTGIGWIVALIWAAGND